MSHPTPLETARAYLRRQWMPLPVPHKSKNPGFKDWSNFRITESELPQYFNGQPQNIGVLLGKTSNNLVDVDLDSTEAVRLAPLLLPPTGAIFGRKSNPRSHWLYYADTTTQKFSDPSLKASQSATKAMLVELRSTGAQTVFPGSTHPSGEVIEWEQTGNPALIEAITLEGSVSRLAAAVLVARNWLPGKRHDVSLALAGFLLRGKWSIDETICFIEAVCLAAQDEEAHKRARNVVTTAARLNNGSAVTGWNALSNLLGKRVVVGLGQWLNISSQALTRGAGKQARSSVDEAHGYVVNDGYFARQKITSEGSTIVKLCNFTAFITTDCTEDDGASERRVYEVLGKLAGKELSHSTGIGAEEFSAMKWVDKLLGAQATVYPAQSEHVRCAIKLLSEDIAETRIFTHTGWRKIDDEWCYLHGGGAIGANGNREDVTVRLPASLEHLLLPDAPQEEMLIYAVRQHLNAIGVAPAKIMFPLFGAIWAAVLGDCDFSEHLSGESGAGKSELAAIAQAHFGAGFDREHLPAAWASTGNSLERLAHAAKDALLVIDDFAPTGNANDTARLHREADRILRAQGNHAGRLRLRSDTTFNSARAPRGLILSTGEDVPRGQSLRARLWVSEIERASTMRVGTINFNKLSECQVHARTGIYARVMAGYLRWLAPQYESVCGNATEVIAQLRNEFSASGGSHKRHATTAAKLMRAWNLFFDFATEIGALNDEEKDSLTGQAWASLQAAAQAQEEQQSSQDMAMRFVELISATLSTGIAHVAELDGSRPDFNQSLYGWREGMPQGKRIGWKDDAHLYLQPDAAFAVANELSGKTGDSLTITPTTLWKRMNERGWLMIEPSQDSLKVRITAERGRKRVIALRLEHFGAEAST